ncbi:major capsid protein, partial [Escherichia coli]|uniref:major capsid protein n=1 Tax=Escherichia coli TaxID=562 RepID=UPI002037393E
GLVCPFGRPSTKPARRVGERVSDFGFDQQGHSELETALKDLGDSVSFKGYMGDVAIVVYSGRYTDEDGTEKHFLDPDLMVLGNTALQGIVAYGGIQDPELIRMGLTKAELAPKNYIVPGDPAIEYVQTHSAPQPIPARINRFVTVRIG